MAGYVFPSVSLTLLLFKVRAQYGIRNFSEAAIVVYVFVCLAHLWVNDFGTALLFRFVAGAAAAPISSLAFLYILDAFQPARNMNIGLCMALLALAIPRPLTGILSPFLLDLGGVRMFYTFEIGAAMVALGLVYLLPLASPPRVKAIRKLDVVSYIFLAVGLGSFAVALTVG